MHGRSTAGRTSAAPQRAGAGTRRTVASKSGGGAAALDDQPLALAWSRDGRKLLATLPYELAIIHAESLELERTIPLKAAAPSVHEADEGVLYLGGNQVHRANLRSAGLTKLGTKLSGVVDRVVLVRPGLLCGAGPSGEVLWAIDEERELHRRRAAEHPVLGLVASPDGRAVWAEGREHAWVIDPDHPEGYMKLALKQTSSHPVEHEAIDVIGTTTAGRTILAARDGAIGWTNRALRLVDERVPAERGRGARPLAVGGDATFVYVLRPAGVLQRFRIERPPEPAVAAREAGARGAAKAAGAGKSASLRGGAARAEPPPPPPPPLAEQAKLGRLATVLAVGPEGGLALGGPESDGALGRVWRVDPATLEWAPLALGERELVPPPTPRASDDGASEGPTAPSFIAIRTKLDGRAGVESIANLRVDDVLGGEIAAWVTRATGTFADRPLAVIDPATALPADTLVLPAMLRLAEGTARPGLVLWPGSADEERDPGAIAFATWGDAPRGFMPLQTPAIREQGWTRRQVFPLQVALPRAVPQAAGYRPVIPAKWHDAELFAALVRECKKLLKVLW